MGRAVSRFARGVAKPYLRSPLDQIALLDAQFLRAAAAQFEHAGCVIPVGIERIERIGRWSWHAMLENAAILADDR